MKYEILVVIWDNNWSQEKTRILPFDSFEEASEFCKKHTSFTEEYKNGKSVKNGVHYRLIGKV